MKKAKLIINIEKKEHITYDKQTIIISFPKFSNFEYMLNLFLDEFDMSYKDISKINKLNLIKRALKRKNIKEIVIQNMENIVFWNFNEAFVKIRQKVLFYRN